MKRYCPACKIETERIARGGCAVCNRRRVREWQKANPKRTAAVKARWKVENRERSREIDLASYHKRMAENPELIRRNRRNAAKTPKGVIANRLARHKRRGAAPDLETREYVPVLYLDPCSYCGESGGELDHIEPLSLGGDGGWSNLAGVCRRCNAQKNGKRLMRFLTREKV